LKKFINQVKKEEKKLNEFIDSHEPQPNHNNRLNRVRKRK
jgi:hypothetical protein